jgi:hypothetical protein
MQPSKQNRCCFSIISIFSSWLRVGYVVWFAFVVATGVLKWVATTTAATTSLINR